MTMKAHDKQPDRFGNNSLQRTCQTNHQSGETSRLKEMSAFWITKYQELSVNLYILLRCIFPCIVLVCVCETQQCNVFIVGLVGFWSVFSFWCSAAGGQSCVFSVWQCYREIKSHRCLESVSSRSRGASCHSTKDICLDMYS